MAKGSKPTPPTSGRKSNSGKTESLPWRITKMAKWREAQPGEMTQQDVADALGELDPPIEYDRVSITRAEAGKQKPPIDVLEAIAKIYGTDVDSMLNKSPKEAEPIIAFRAYKEDEQRRMIRMYEAGKDTGE